MADLFSVCLQIIGAILQLVFWTAIAIFRLALSFLVGMFGYGSRGFATILTWMFALVWLPFKIFAMMFGLLLFRHNDF